jgi:hypothetical protein
MRKRCKWEGQGDGKRIRIIKSQSNKFIIMNTKQQPVATSVALAPSLLQQVGMAGSAAVITVSFIHPIDVVKTRIQVSPEYAALGMGGTVKHVVNSEGVLAMWKGVNAGEYLLHNPCT